ncbi:MAG: cupredoxin domain-containing protein [Polyangiaceae bacterium]|jgi:hypothetical protein
MGHPLRVVRVVLATVTAASLVAGAHCTTSTAGACTPDDADGIQGGAYVFDLQVSDTAFTPIILTAENLAQVTVTLKNTGTKPHDFVVQCMATPNDNGCPTTSCFPDASTIGPLAPDASATATFETPNPEGTYNFYSDLPGDTQTGQFIVQ